MDAPRRARPLAPRRPCAKLGLQAGSHMRSPSTAAAIATLLLLAACVPLQPTLQSTARPGAAGYVAGFLRRGEGEGFALRLTETGGKEYFIPFERNAADAEPKSRPVMIEVPPGTYRIASWVTYNFAHERVAQQDVPEKHALGRPFTLAAGQVLLLGALEASTVHSIRRVDWAVQPLLITEPAAVAAFREAYPAFAHLPVTCLMCLSEEEVRRREEAERARRKQPRIFDLQLTPPNLGGQ